MKNLRLNDMELTINKTFDLLFSLESVIKLTHETCLQKEINSNYYNLLTKEKCLLSDERNHYINLLSIALDKISCLKEINSKLEKEFIYNNIPTIAADK